MPLARVGTRTESTTRYSYNARRGQLPRTRIGIVRRTRARHAVCAEGLHFSAFHIVAVLVQCTCESGAAICGKTNRDRNKNSENSVHYNLQGVLQLLGDSGKTQWLGLNNDRHQQHMTTNDNGQYMVQLLWKT